MRFVVLLFMTSQDTCSKISRGANLECSFCRSIARVEYLLQSKEKQCQEKRKTAVLTANKLLNPCVFMCCVAVSNTTRVLYVCHCKRGVSPILALFTRDF